MTLPTFLPLEEAATRTGKPVEWLRELLTNGKIVAGQLPDGEKIIAVDAEGNVIETPAQPETRPEGVRELPAAVAGDDINAQLAAIRREDFKHLEGTPITAKTASLKYDVPISTLHRWAKNGYIAVIHKGTSKADPSTFEEMDVAYCSKVYNTRKTLGTISGAPLFEDDGRPYLLKYPRLSKLRKNEKRGA